MVDAEKAKKHSGRIDLIIQNVESVKTNPDGSKVISVAMIPDPRRYEWIERNGERMLRDKNTNIYIPEKELKNISSMEGAPIYYSPPIERDYCKYLLKQKADLQDHWNEPYKIEDKMSNIDELLMQLSGKDTQVVILYVDLESSTALSAQVDSDTNLKIIKIFTKQMAMVINNFRGYVLKYVGDCVIGIFPADENFTSMSVNAIQAAMIMRNVMEDVINPIFADKGLPNIGCHIGLDIGIVKADRVGAINISAIDDLIGYPMNLTAKIQSRSGHNGILVGQHLFELLHCTWQEKCEKADLGPDWKMKDPIHDRIYDVYNFKGYYKCKHLEKV